MKFKATGLFLAILLGLSSTLLANPPAMKSVVVGVISSESKTNFESQILPILKTQMQSCSLCEIRNLSTYNDKGEFDETLLSDKLKVEGPQINFLIVHWNGRYHPELEPVVAEFKKLTSSGVIVIGSAGVAKKNELLMPLSRTVLAQVPDLVIIGELEERERLLNQAYFGPEMLTAITPPKEYMGQGYSSLFFGSKLATHWTRKSSEDWIAHFKATKSKSRRIWPGLEEFFGR